MNGIWLPLALVLIAEACAQSFGIHSDTLAAPSTVAVTAWHGITDGSFMTATVQTLQSALLGLLIGGGSGLIASIFLGLFNSVARLTFVSVEVFRPIPSVALIPIAILVFGLGFQMEISIVAFSCFWPFLILGQSAVRGIHPRLLEVSRALRFTLFQRTRKIVLPAMLSRIFVATRLSAGIALIVAVTVEITANPLGLGHALMLAQQSLRPDLMFATLLWVGIIGWALNYLLLWTQRKLLGRFFAEVAP